MHLAKANTSSSQFATFPTIRCFHYIKSSRPNKLQWNLNRNSHIFIQENAFENVWKMAAILSQPQSVKAVKTSFSYNMMQHSMILNAAVK